MLLIAATRGEVAPATDRWTPYVGGKIAVHEVDCEHVHMMQPRSIGENRRCARKELEKQSRRFK